MTDDLNLEIGPSLMSTILKYWAYRNWSRTRLVHRPL